MSFCEECGSEIEKGNSFCSNCGTPVAEDTGKPGKPGKPEKQDESRKKAKGAKEKGPKADKASKPEQAGEGPGDKAADGTAVSGTPVGGDHSEPKAEATPRQPLPPRQDSPASPAAASAAPGRRKGKKVLVAFALFGVVAAAAVIAVAKFYDPTERAVGTAAEDSVVKTLKKNPDGAIGFGSKSNAFLGALSEEGLSPRTVSPEAKVTVDAIQDNAAVASVDVTYEGGIKGDDPSHVIPVEERWRVGLRKNREGNWKPTWYFVTSSEWSLPGSEDPQGPDLKAANAAAEKAVKDFGTLRGEDYEAWNKAQLPNYLSAEAAPTLDGYEEDGYSSPAAKLLFAILYGDNEGGSDVGDLNLDSLTVRDVSANGQADTLEDDETGSKFLDVAQNSVTANFGGGTFSACAGTEDEGPAEQVDSDVVFLVQVVRSRLGSDSPWLVTRMTALDEGSVTEDTTQVDVSGGSSYYSSEAWDEATLDASYEDGDGVC